MQSSAIHKSNWFRWLPALFFAAAIFTFASIPGRSISTAYRELGSAMQTVSPARVRAPVRALRIDWLKTGHAIGYFCLGFSVLYALPDRSRRSLLSALVICSLYAVSDELHQAIVPGRSASARDILLDSLAALAGILIFFVMSRWQPRRREDHANKEMTEL